MIQKLQQRILKATLQGNYRKLRNLKRLMATHDCFKKMNHLGLDSFKHSKKMTLYSILNTYRWGLQFKLSYGILSLGDQTLTKENLMSSSKLLVCRSNLLELQSCITFLSKNFKIDQSLLNLFYLKNHIHKLLNQIFLETKWQLLKKFKKTPFRFRWHLTNSYLINFKTHFFHVFSEKNVQKLNLTNVIRKLNIVPNFLIVHQNFGTNFLLNISNSKVLKKRMKMKLKNQIKFIFKKTGKDYFFKICEKISRLKKFWAEQFSSDFDASQKQFVFQFWKKVQKKYGLVDF